MTDSLSEEMTKRLMTAFHPTHLEVIDDGASHRGHAATRDGARHFIVVITASEFNSMTRVEAHRAIYALFSDLMPKPLHALKIQIQNK